MRLSRVRFADLDAVWLEPDGPPKQVALLCHGFGAPGDDLVSLAHEAVAVNPTLAHTTAFCFPAAPIDLLMFGGRAWWKLDLQRLQQITAGQPVGFRKETPKELPKVRRLLRATIDAVLAHSALTMGELVIGGFSQGAMLTTDLVLNLEEAPKALCIFSGTLLNEDEWLRLAPRRVGLRVLQSHGRQDPILPFEAALALRELLTQAGLEVEFEAFDGAHTIAASAFAKFVELLG